MADATDFPPEADPPPAEKSFCDSASAKDESSMTLDTAIKLGQERPAAYVLSGTRPNYLYKGSCRNLPKRLADHVAGRVSHTKNIRPLVLVCFQYCETNTEARRIENFWKSGAGRAWLQNWLSSGTLETELQARVAEWQTQRT